MIEYSDHVTNLMYTSDDELLMFAEIYLNILNDDRLSYEDRVVAAKRQMKQIADALRMRKL